MKDESVVGFIGFPQQGSADHSDGLPAWANAATLAAPVRTPQTDLRAFGADLDALRADVRRDRAAHAAEDLAHYRRIAGAGRALTLLGLATCWLYPNPLTVLALALGTFVRWAVVGHHVCHRGYDRVPGAPAHLRGLSFARDRRRLVDWLDWMHPDAWHYEHDVLHHYKLGETPGDPDQPEANAWWLRESGLPMPLRRLVVLLGSTVWKPLYYAPNTLMALRNHTHPDEPPVGLYDWRLWAPWRPRFWMVVRRCWLPYATWRFGLLPALFLPLGTTAWKYALLNLLLAELVTNFWSFWVIVPNHAGDDLLRFDTPVRDRPDFYYRQVVGSVNYRTGGDVRDLLHGWLNYQIEHHLFPDLPARAYQRIQPRVQEICERHGVPYLQESIFLRARRTMDVLTGTATMPHAPHGAAAPAVVENPTT